MKKSLKNILIPCVLALSVAAGNVIFYHIPLIFVSVVIAILIPLCIGMYKEKSWDVITIIVFLSVLIAILLVFLIAFLSKSYSWFEYVFYFPFYSEYVN